MNGYIHTINKYDFALSNDEERENTTSLSTIAHVGSSGIASNDFPGHESRMIFHAHRVKNGGKVTKL